LTLIITFGILIIRKEEVDLMNRKIIKQEELNYQVGNSSILKARCVYYLLNPEETKTTIKAGSLVISCYLNNTVNFKGTSVIHRSQKTISINKKTLKSKGLTDSSILNAQKEALSEAYTKYLASMRTLEGEVTDFDMDTGEGWIKLKDLGSFTVYACNLKGRKSWWPHLACTYLEVGQKVTVDRLAETAGGLTCVVSKDVKFDPEKWDSIDRKDCSFTEQDDGFMSGLLAKGESL
jgi:hypothetical protein